MTVKGIVKLLLLIPWTHTSKMTAHATAYSKINRHQPLYTCRHIDTIEDLTQVVFAGFLIKRGCLLVPMLISVNWHGSINKWRQGKVEEDALSDWQVEDAMALSLTWLEVFYSPSHLSTDSINGLQEVTFFLPFTCLFFLLFFRLTVVLCCRFWPWSCPSCCRYFWIELFRVHSRPYAVKG